jgi:hypothetical protein
MLILATPSVKSVGGLHDSFSLKIKGLPIDQYILFCRLNSSNQLLSFTHYFCIYIVVFTNLHWI